MKLNDLLANRMKEGCIANRDLRMRGATSTTALVETAKAGKFGMTEGLLINRSWNLIYAIRGALRGSHVDFAFRLLPWSGLRRANILLLMMEEAGLLNNREAMNRARDLLLDYIKEVEAHKGLDADFVSAKNRVMKSLREREMIFDLSRDFLDIPEENRRMAAMIRYRKFISEGRFDEASEISKYIAEDWESRFNFRITTLSKYGHHDKVRKMISSLKDPLQKRRAKRLVFRTYLREGFLTEAKKMLEADKRLKLNVEEALLAASLSGYCEVVDYVIQKYKPIHKDVIRSLVTSESWDLLWYYIDRMHYIPDDEMIMFMFREICGTGSKHLENVFEKKFGLRLKDLGKVVDPFEIYLS